MSKAYLRILKECDGGVSAPFQLPSNTVGIGNPVPAQMSGSTAAEQSSVAAVGSGDKFGSIVSVSDQKPKKYKKSFNRKKHGGSTK